MSRPRASDLAKFFAMPQGLVQAGDVKDLVDDAVLALRRAWAGGPDVMYQVNGFLWERIYDCRYESREPARQEIFVPLGLAEARRRLEEERAGAARARMPQDQAARRYRITKARRRLTREVLHDRAQRGGALAIMRAEWTERARVWRRQLAGAQYDVAGAMHEIYTLRLRIERRHRPNGRPYAAASLSAMSSRMRRYERDLATASRKIEDLLSTTPAAYTTQSWLFRQIERLEPRKKKSARQTAEAWLRRQLDGLEPREG